MDIDYDSASRLASMGFQGGRLTSPLSLIYDWDEADQLTRRTWNGRTLRYEYDASGQLIKVFDEHDASLLEAYTYDLAGNMLTKLLDGKVTTMSYNAANHLVSSTEQDSAPLAYHYDRAGRMTGIGPHPTKTYGWLDKLIRNTQPDGSTTTHTYWPDGQIASISSSSPSTIPNPPSSSPSPSQSQIPNLKSPSDCFLWDGLALLMRNDTIYLIEPHPSGGIPIASHPIGKPQEITFHLNDLLGTTLATAGPAGVNFSALSSFGQPLKASSHTVTAPSSPSAPTNPVPSNNQLPPTQQ